ncbi:unnamed protein product (macronuclear) [Paramecium tetraurelia]|uniref:Uncharacterized protein n=1 Tax=Paramecium tetraurelia TaxID=5888 RepID=A0BI28_PARTE|nr:uncharacterized protein GSPATT00029231001 [Paramecium tetraurelia]CAK58195.1 unnamed protein product [Paramecium tetraurelia]|eukprot:XP_001425593.1 hypothetical protein (macronuclear) [Paramecium tetraurelia strain d4-2]
MSCFIKLTQRAKRTLSIEADFQNQGYLPKLQLAKSRALTCNNKNYIAKNSKSISSKINSITPRVISRPVINDFHFRKLQNCRKATPLKELKMIEKSTNKKTVQKKPSLDFSLSGFQMMDIEREDCFLQSYVRKQ